MADIFISYSSKDREKAEQLTELLISAGLSVWIDRSSLEVSTSWSAEIVDAISSCTAFIVLLSPNSIESHNVIKEVSLASEKRKKILPLDLEPIAIPRELEYQLAGIHRTSMTNIDAIIRAIGKLGLEATQAPTMKIVKESDGRKSLMILPFEDLSPTGDNGWFADGIATELISALSNVKSLHLSDAQATKEFKSYKGQLTEYARIMQVRYFVQGSVRKFGDQIKITAQLLDIDTGDYLWQHSLKGVMENIFDIQEEVAKEVLKGLEVHLTSDEKQKLAKRGTASAEAYELCIRATDYFGRHTKEGFTLSKQLNNEAIRLDPNYAHAHYGKGISLIQLYRYYDRTPGLLDEAEIACNEALRLQPDTLSPYDPLAQIYMHRGDLTKAEQYVREYVRLKPQLPQSHFSLAFFLGETGRQYEAIAPYEEAVRLDPDSLLSISNLVYNCNSAGEQEKCAYWASVALPYVERLFKLQPDNERNRLQYTLMLFLSGNIETARKAIEDLSDLKDGNNLYNMACLISKLGDPVRAVETIRKAIKAGLKNISSLKEFMADKKEGIVDLAGTPEYEAVMRMIEELEREAVTKKQTSV